MKVVHESPGTLPGLFSVEDRALYRLTSPPVFFYNGKS